MPTLHALMIWLILGTNFFISNHVQLIEFYNIMTSTSTFSPTLLSRKLIRIISSTLLQIYVTEDLSSSSFLVGRALLALKQDIRNLKTVLCSNSSLCLHSPSTSSLSPTTTHICPVHSILPQSQINLLSSVVEDVEAYLNQTLPIFADDLLSIGKDNSELTLPECLSFQSMVLKLINEVKSDIDAPTITALSSVVIIMNIFRRP